jgi:hypothetical protein
MAKDGEVNGHENYSSYLKAIRLDLEPFMIESSTLLDSLLGKGIEAE